MRRLGKSTVVSPIRACNAIGSPQFYECHQDRHSPPREKLGRQPNWRGLQRPTYNWHRIGRTNSSHREGRGTPSCHSETKNGLARDDHSGSRGSRGWAVMCCLASQSLVTLVGGGQPVKFLAPAELDDPEWRRLGATEAGAGRSEFSECESNPHLGPGTDLFVEPRIRAAAQLGFTPARLFKPFMGGIYKTHDVLMVSRSQQIHAVVRWGTTALIRNKGDCALFPLSRMACIW